MKKKIVFLDEVARKFKPNYLFASVEIGRTNNFIVVHYGVNNKVESYSFECIRAKYKADKIQLGLLDYYDETICKECKKADCFVLFYH